MNRAWLLITLRTLIAASLMWAVPVVGAAHKFFTPPEAIEKQAGTANAISVKFRDSRSRGLLIDVFVDGRGPFVLALDTGAGISIISRQMSINAQIPIRKSAQPLVGGLSTSPISADEETTVSKLALGSRDGMLVQQFKAAVSNNLPAGIDGILDPADVSPYGYSIDLPNRVLQVFDFTGARLRESEVPAGGTVVRWSRDRGRRPFVRLGDGRLALLDTGSSFGLAVSDGIVAGRNHGRNQKSIRDLGGGVVNSTRVSPTTVTIGSLVLRGVPTDVLSGVAAGTPVILGRDALYPFRITFDPIARLIAIQP